MKQKVLVGMSGGVDSSVTAFLLMQDFLVEGATMKLFDNEQILNTSKTCCALEDTEDARRVCHRLGIEHHSFQFTDVFYDEVIRRFADSYTKGETPNPCVDCNRYVKFPHLLRRAKLLGFDSIATGHYAVIRWDEEKKRHLLYRGKDKTKDQSYVLYPFTQEELAHTLLPLGDKTKDEIRQIAEQNNLHIANKPDSQDICFIPDGDYGKFLREKMGTPTQEGNIYHTNGELLGKHSGTISYTIGQRRGLGLAYRHPLYVIRKDIVQNQVIVGAEADLFTSEFFVRDVNWIAIESLTTPEQVTVMTRYRDKEGEATIYPLENGRVKVSLTQKKRAVTPGQAAVFYQGDMVLGGGTICSETEEMA